MSASSSRRRQLADHEKPARPPVSTVGKVKGPARKAPEVVTILASKRISAEVEYRAGRGQAIAERERRFKRLALALVLIVAATAALVLLTGAR